jgi:anti-sigma regulatory factor (Ser/Thr protein kinase)
MPEADETSVAGAPAVVAVRLRPDVPMQMFTCISAVCAIGACRSLREVGADGAAIAHRVNEVLLGQGVTKAIALQTAIAVEELVVCVHLNNAHQRHDVHFDTIVRNLDDSVQVSLRDNGTPFDPAHANEIAPKGTPEERETAMDGMAVLKSLATSVEYHYTLGLNHTVIQLSKGTDASPARDEHSEVDE